MIGREDNEQTIDAFPNNKNKPNKRGSVIAEQFESKTTQTTVTKYALCSNYCSNV